MMLPIFSNKKIAIASGNITGSMILPHHFALITQSFTFDVYRTKSIKTLVKYIYFAPFFLSLTNLVDVLRTFSADAERLKTLELLYDYTQHFDSIHTHLIVQEFLSSKYKKKASGIIFTKQVICGCRTSNSTQSKTDANNNNISQSIINDYVQSTKPDITFDIKNHTETHDLDNCIICSDADICTVLIPCGHMMMCGICSMAIYKDKKECPKCRSEIINIVKVFKE